MQTQLLINGARSRTVGNRGIVPYTADGKDSEPPIKQTGSAYVRGYEQRVKQPSEPRGAMTMKGRELKSTIEENGFIIIASMITLVYWLIDSLFTDKILTRTLIALSICIYGIFTQYLISSQRAAKKALQDFRHELEQRFLYEDIGFLTDKEGRIEGITERALDHTGKSHESLLGSNIVDLLHDSCREDFKRELPQAWKGLTLHLNVRLAGQKDPKKIFEAKLTRMTVSGKTLLLAILH
jgi:PAS domain-containing protein